MLIHYLLVTLFITAAVAVRRDAAPPGIVRRHSNLHRRHEARSLPTKVPTSLVAKPTSTPSYVRPAPAKILPLLQILPYAGAVQGLQSGSILGAAVAASKLVPAPVRPKQKRGLCGLPLLPACPPATTVKTTSTSSTAAPTTSPTASVSCLDSTTNQAIINSLFSTAGANVAVMLCPGATILTSAPVQFTASNQTLVTLGRPTDSTRATLVAGGANQANVITGNCAYCDNLQLRNVQINGNRPALGYIGNVDGNALVEMGGTTRNHVVDNVHLYDTRSWSCMHAIEGTDFGDGNGPYCSGFSITNSQVGPCGVPPSPGQPQERKRAVATPATANGPYLWADGISLACKQSSVLNNVVTDPTDGGIVVFGAPGSTISGNTITAVNLQLMGGINAVDFGPFSGNYTGTRIFNNIVHAQSAMIKVGIGAGTMTWGSYDSPSFRTFGAAIYNNNLISSPTGYFAFGLSAAGVNATSITGNTFTTANFGGQSSSKCIPQYLPPTPGPAYVDTTTTTGLTLQSNFNSSSFLVFLICDQPGPVTEIGYTTLS